jgi:hypothetical protein
MTFTNFIQKLQEFKMIYAGNPHILNIPSQQNFFESLFEWLLKNFPKEIANVKIFLPNHRSCREFQQVFLQKNSNKSHILPKIIENTISYKHLYITADSHNSAIYQFFVRASEGKRTAIFNDWPDIYRNFKPIGKQTIYYTEQYVAEYQR